MNLEIVRQTAGRCSRCSADEGDEARVTSRRGRNRGRALTENFVEVRCASRRVGPPTRGRGRAGRPRSGMTYRRLVEEFLDAHPVWMAEANMMWDCRGPGEDGFRRSSPHTGARHAARAWTSRCSPQCGTAVAFLLGTTMLPKATAPGDRRPRPCGHRRACRILDLASSRPLDFAVRSTPVYCSPRGRVARLFELYATLGAKELVPVKSRPDRHRARNGWGWGGGDVDGRASALRCRG